MKRSWMGFKVMIFCFGWASATAAASLSGNKTSSGPPAKPIIAPLSHLVKQPKPRQASTNRIMNPRAAKPHSDQYLDSANQMMSKKMVFDQSYLDLQKAEQEENKSYNSVSKIMKTKHNTVKNSVGNVR